MEELEILKSGHFFTVTDFCDSREADTEDIFAPAVYAEIVNRSYNLPENHCITTEKLSNESSTTRLVKQVEAMFNVMPNSIPEFNHYDPAMWLFQNGDILENDSEEVSQTLDTAERIFKAFNKLFDAEQ